jgi:hypothetical protein
MPNKLEIQQALRDCLGCYTLPTYWPTHVSVELDGGDVTYDMLAKLAERLGTKINLNYHEGCSGYSEWTPGYPGNLYLEITINPS